MTALHVYVLVCNGPECDARFSCDARRADETRAQSVKQGWSHGLVPPNPHRGGPAKALDYCPRHLDLAEGLQPKTLPQHARAVDA